MNTQKSINQFQTFEELVSPIVEENLRIRFPYFWNGDCCSEEFQKYAAATTKRLDGILSLDAMYYSGRVRVYIDLCSPVKFPWLHFVTQFSVILIVAMIGFASERKEVFDLSQFLAYLKWGVGGGLLFAVLQLLISAPSHFYRRRSLARQVLGRAKELDQNK